MDTQSTKTNPVNILLVEDDNIDAKAFLRAMKKAEDLEPRHRRARRRRGLGTAERQRRLSRSRGRTS